MKGITCGIPLYDILSILWFCGQGNASYNCMIWWERVCSWRGQFPTTNLMDVCEKLNMKYNAQVFLIESAKGTSEVTQNTQFILRGLRMKFTSSFIGPCNTTISSLYNAENWIWPRFPPFIMQKIECGLPATWFTHVNQLLIAWQEKTHMSKNAGLIYKYLTWHCFLQENLLQILRLMH